MITAELKHNPYLLETEVKFNGQSPKINSQIEKYENQILSEWVKAVPGIFYDEMNGYDFDLFFSGTKYDFQKLKQAFINLGVSSDQVRIIMRNELESAEMKSREIREMIAWLREERNRQFDFDAFYDANKEILEETFYCVVIRGMDEQKEEAFFNIENVKSVGEIAEIDLAYVPIVFVVDESTLQQFRRELEEVLERKDIEQKQLFFCLSPTMDKDYVIRIIWDLGVEEPQIISSMDDGRVAAYIQNYPMVARVSDVIQIVKQEVNDMELRLKEKNKQSAIENAEVYVQISKLEEVIEKIKKSDSYFVNLEYYSCGTIFYDLKKELKESIENWKSRKIKAVGAADIDRNAAEYEQELLSDIAGFYRKANSEYQYRKEKIEQKFGGIYLKQPLDSKYSPEDISLDMPDKTRIMGIKEELIALKEEYLEEKTDLFDFFKSSSEPKEMVSVVVCYYQKWRERAKEFIMPSVEKYIEESQKNLRNYYERLAGKYHEKLSQLHDDKVKEKNSIASQLSEDERMLQADNDWLMELKDRLVKVERG